MSPLVLGKIYGVFVNTLTGDGKYPVRECENLLLPIQVQLIEKRKAFSQLFVPFLESTSNFKHFEINMMVVADEFPKLQTVKNFARPFCKMGRFRKRFYSQDVKVCQVLAKSP